MNSVTMGMDQPWCYVMIGLILFGFVLAMCKEGK